MQTSESLAKLAPALAKAQADLEHAAKDKTNPHFKSSYADLPGVIDAIKPVYKTHGLMIVQGFAKDDAGVTIQTRIMHTSGEWIEDEGLTLPIDKRTAQAVGSAVTYGRRYTIGALTGLATSEDDDGNAASAVVGSTPTVRRTPAPVKVAPAKKAKVTPEQAKELAAAAIAAGVDPSVAEAKARLTDADKFIETLEKFKAKAGGQS